MQENHHVKFAFFLPNIFTALNMACGFAAIMLSLNFNIRTACFVLGLGAVFDLVDGRVARLTGTTSSFGEQFDSLSDLVSFGMAPSLVFYQAFLSDFNRLGMIVAFIYILCGALRLARFNANIEKVSSEYFQGIPIPGAALAQIGLCLFSLEFDFPPKVKMLCILYIFFYSLLMISNIPFPSFKNSAWVKSHKKQSLAIIFALLTSLFLYEEVVLLIVLNLYVILSILYYVKNRNKFRGIFQWKNEDLA